MSFYVDPGSQTQVLKLTRQALNDWAVSSVPENNLFIVFGPGAVQPNHDLQINPCSVRLVDIKKENLSYSLDDNQQTQARTNENKGSEIIGKEFNRFPSKGVHVIRDLWGSPGSQMEAGREKGPPKPTFSLTEESREN